MMPAEPGRGPDGRAARQLASATTGAPRPTGPSREAPSRERHLRLVEPVRRPRFNRHHVLAWAGIAVVAGFALALVMLHVLIAQAQFRLDGLQQEANQQQATYEKLRLSVAQLESPARIVSIAEGELGMQQPGSVTYLPAPSARVGSLKAGLSPNGPTVDSPVTGSGSRSQLVTPAPAGDADWPSIKPYLSGSP